jgi:hypothetical protein
MIPFTNLNICHKNQVDQKRCFVFGYQVTINVKDMAPQLKAMPYAKIRFNSMNSRMLILPGDRIGIRFGSTDFPYEAIRMMPDIHSASLPEPFRTRYQTSGVRLPCNDVMIADSMECTDTDVYCTSADQMMKMHIVGAGEIFTLNRNCKDFFAKNFNWEAEQKRLEQDTTAFSGKFSDGNQQPKEFDISEVTFTDSQDNEYKTSEGFSFKYTIGWMFSSNYPYQTQSCSLYSKLSTTS